MVHYSFIIGSIMGFAYASIWLNSYKRVVQDFSNLPSLAQGKTQGRLSLLLARGAVIRIVLLSLILALMIGYFNYVWLLVGFFISFWASILHSRSKL